MFIVVVSGIGEDGPGDAVGPFHTEAEAEAFIREIDEYLLDQTCDVLEIITGEQAITDAQKFREEMDEEN